jgi:hypothetical protein
MRRDFFSFPSILNDSFERQVNGGGMARVYILPKIVMFFRGFLKESNRMIIFIPENKEKRYRKVASSSMSWLTAHLRIFRMLMKRKFDAYVP